MRYLGYTISGIICLNILLIFNGCGTKVGDLQTNNTTKKMFDMAITENAANDYGFDQEPLQSDVHVSLKADAITGKAKAHINIINQGEYSKIVARSSDPAIFVLTGFSGSNADKELILNDNDITIYSKGATGQARIIIVGVDDKGAETVVSGCDPALTEKCKKDLFVDAYTEPLIPAMTVNLISDPSSPGSEPPTYDASEVLNRMNQIAKQAVIRFDNASVKNVPLPVSYDFNGNGDVEYYDYQMWKGEVLGVYQGEFEPIAAAFEKSSGTNVAFVKKVNVAYELAQDIPAGSVTTFRLYSNNGIIYGGQSSNVVVLSNGVSETPVVIKNIIDNGTYFTVMINPINGPFASRKKWGLTANAIAGATTINLTNATSLNAGNTVIIGPDARDDGTTEVVTITAVNGNQITIQDPLVFEHLSGVSTQTIVAATSGSTSSITIADQAAVSWLCPDNGTSWYKRLVTIREGVKSEEFLVTAYPEGIFPVKVPITDLVNTYTNAAQLSAVAHAIQKPISCLINKSVGGISTTPPLVDVSCSQSASTFAETITHELFHSMYKWNHVSDVRNLMYYACHAGSAKLNYRALEETNNQNTKTGKMVNQWNSVIR